ARVAELCQPYVDFFYRCATPCSFMFPIRLLNCAAIMALHALRLDRMTINNQFYSSLMSLHYLHNVFSFLPIATIVPAQLREILQVLADQKKVSSISQMGTEHFSHLM